MKGTTWPVCSESDPMPTDFNAIEYVTKMLPGWTRMDYPKMSVFQHASLPKTFLGVGVLNNAGREYTEDLIDRLRHRWPELVAGAGGKWGVRVRTVSWLCQDGGDNLAFEDRSLAEELARQCARQEAGRHPDYAVTYEVVGYTGGEGGKEPGIEPRDDFWPEGRPSKQ